MTYVVKKCDFCGKEERIVNSAANPLANANVQEDSWRLVRMENRNKADWRTDDDENMCPDCYKKLKGGAA